MGIVGTSAGGGKVTVEGLDTGAVKKGVTVTVKQGSKVVKQTTGTYDPQKVWNLGEKKGRKITYDLSNITQNKQISTKNIVCGIKSIDAAKGSYGINSQDCQPAISKGTLSVSITGKIVTITVNGLTAQVVDSIGVRSDFPIVPTITALYVE